MNKKIILLLLFSTIIPSVFAINLEVNKTSSDEAMIYGVDKPVSFNLKITNLGADDNLQFFNLVGFNMFPIGTVPIKALETQDVKVEIYPTKGFNHRGYYTFVYYIMGQDKTKLEQRLTFNVIDLDEAFEIGSLEMDPETSSIKVYLANKVNFNFTDVNAKINSAFFNLDQDFPLAPYEKKEFDIQLNKEEFKKLMAGFYTLKAEVTVEDQKVNLEGYIKFVEKDIVTSTKKDYGLIISTKIIEKTNEGNVISSSETIVQKNIISRLFTTFEPQPDFVERQGFDIFYTWKRDLKPGESLSISVKTNWLYPLLVIIFIILVVVIAKQYSKTDLVLKKSVHFVNAKGGEFALKVSVIVKAKNYIERVNIIDRLPSLVKVHERFIGDIPSRVNEAARKIEWDFEKLEAGETRILSYLIYSKVGVLGKFALPSATAIYEKKGKIHESVSNQAFFVAEQINEEIVD
jgi:hypothetical protein